MSWPMQTTGQWNPGIAPMPDTNISSFTPEQWTAMQQQNWHQWAQWQQQYAQWQTQYGDKYAQQMQVIQQMGSIPPLPTQAAPPAPPAPPPDHPPPPPHENNQPLFKPPQGHGHENNQPSCGSSQGRGQPAPVPAPIPSQRQNQNPGSFNNAIVTAIGNNPNWSYPPETPTETNHATANEDALKKLAEEERLFDIQFKKWEEEIQKWKKDNANHPDRQAYKEYEDKFEACRAQLLERRQQMKQKRASLLGIPSQKANIAAPSNTSPGVPPSLQNPGNNYNQNMSLQNLRNHQSQNYAKQDSSQFQQYGNKPQPGNNRNNNIKIELQDRYDNNINNNRSIVPQDRFDNRKTNKNIDPQDRNELYQNVNDNLPPSRPDNSNFLLRNATTKGIPGLDLVPEADKASANKQHEVIDITDEHPDIQRQQYPHGPDYSTISKGINNILGDEKIMNILSMVKGQNVPQEQNIAQGNRNQNANSGNSPYTVNSTIQNNPPSNQWARNDNTYSNQQYGNGQNMPFNRQGPGPNYPGNEEMNFPNVRKRMSQDQYYDENAQYGSRNATNIPTRPQPLMSQSVPIPRPLLPNPQGQHNMNDFHRGPQENREIDDNNMKPNIPPVQPPQSLRAKWIDEPLFTPSIIVDYEHKPLRLKARDFIEAVHMFDYDHKSKDGETKKRNFEEEVDELFSRLPTRREYNDENNRFSRDSRDSAKDYERRKPREEIREDYHRRGPSRDEYDERRRPNRLDRYDERRRDDRDRLRRDERETEPFRDREPFRERDPLRDRDRETLRDREREPLRDREREPLRDREREPLRDREREPLRDREREPLRDREREPLRDREREPFRDRDRDRGDRDSRESHRDRNRDYKRDERDRNRSRSHDRDSRKRGHSRESDVSVKSTPKKSKETEPVHSTEQKRIIMIDDILEPPGRDMRPEKIVIILRGLPGSGKSYLAKLIRDKEAEYGGTARIMSIDDYFMQEGLIEETDPTTGKIIKKPSLKYEYDEKLEETYLTSLRKSFKRSLCDGYFSFLIFDAVNDQLKHYADIWNCARQYGFQVYVCTMELDPQTCFKRNIHNRTLEDIEVICCRFFPTPAHHLQLDPTTLLQSAGIEEVQMEDVDHDDVIMEDQPEVETSFTSKWEKMDNVDKLARLDGTSKPLRPSQLSIEDYLQLDDWIPTTAKPGKKTVRWADIEERRQQEKMRAIGFVVGQTDWNRMTDPTMGSSALTQTKYIERVRRFY